MPAVSIIIPVYNAAKPWKEEKTALHRCLDSVLSQDFGDFELILVDDGSNDASPAILDAYAAADSRITVIHKPNSGVSDTRNRGIERACGDYIQFIDADDWLDPEAVKLMVRTIRSTGADMVISDFYRVVGEYTSAKGDIEGETVVSRSAYAEYMMKNPADFYYGVLWNKLFRTDIIREHGIRMDTDLSWCEDFIFNLEYVLHCGTIAALHIPVYYYVKTEGSLVAKSLSVSNAVRMKLSLIEYYDSFYREILPKSEYLQRKPVIYGYLVSFAGDNMANPAAFSTKKLGKERVSALLRDGADGNAYTLLYYMEKLMDRYLETAASAFDLELRDAKLLLYGLTVDGYWEIREAADFARLPFPAAAASIEKLILKKLVSRSFEGLRAFYRLTSNAAPVLDALRQALDDYAAVFWDGRETGEWQAALSRARKTLGGS